MKVLFIASEAFPFIKTGGLGDVIFALPRELRRLGVDARVMIPKYGDIPAFFREKMTCRNIFNVQVGWRNQYCGVEELKYEDMPFYFVDNEYYFKRPGIYGFYDEAERYAFFCRAALEAVKYMDFKPDILHCHDWQTGMISVLLKAHYQNVPGYERLKTIFTIHNLNYQGVFPREILGDLLNLSEDYYNIDAVEFYGGVSFMKGGLSFADILTTVSQTYAEEIQTPYFGERMDDLLRKRREELHGIVNGIDYGLYNPKRDKNIYLQYDAESSERKRENKLRLQEELGLPVNGDIPMMAMVTRLTTQKGIDIVAYILDELLAMELQLVVLGTGENRYENLFRDYAAGYPQKLAARIMFDETLSRRIYAASDIFLMPSLFEPCGIGQLIALRYGSLPIVRETGGLRDTVKSYNEYTEEGNGFSFAHYNAHDMLFTIKRALDLYNDSKAWSRLRQSAMREDFGWSRSALKYRELYEKLIK